MAARELLRAPQIDMYKILLLEPASVASMSYRNKLRMEGFDVQTAEDGRKGLNLLLNWQPGVLVVDLMISGISGIEVLKRVRANNLTKDVPVVVMTNAFVASKIEEAWKAGATKCLCKASCTPNDFVQIVRGLFKPASPQPVHISPAQHSALAVASRVASSASNEPLTPHPSEGEKFQPSLRESLRAGLAEQVGKVRADLRELCRLEAPATRSQLLTSMAMKVHSLSANAKTCGLPLVASLADALVALLKQTQDATAVSGSVLKTIAATLDLFLHFHQQGFPPDQHFHRANILIVDDDEISRRAVSYSLRRVKLHGLLTGDPVAALHLARENRFDLIVLDIDMPILNGIDLCADLRKTPEHKTTPILFVTCHDDFAIRTGTVKSGGNDFITKPFCPMELALKALVCIFKANASAGSPAIASPSAVPICG